MRLISAHSFSLRPVCRKDTAQAEAFARTHVQVVPWQSVRTTKSLAVRHTGIASVDIAYACEALDARGNLLGDCTTTQTSITGLDGWPDVGTYALEDPRPFRIVVDDQDPARVGLPWS